LLAEAEITLFYVRHHLQELSLLCDEVIILEEGGLAYFGDIQGALTHQSSPLIHNAQAFVSIRARVSDYDREYGISRLVSDNGQHFYVLAQHELNDQVQIHIEANNVSLELPQSSLKEPLVRSSVLNQLDGVLEQVLLANNQSMLLLIDCAGDKILSKISRLSYERMALGLGCSLRVLVKAAAIYEF